MTLSTTRLWELFGEDLRGFIARQVGSDDHAQDLLQDTFVRIHKGLGNLREEDRVLAWVYQVARSTIAEHRRRRREAGTLEVEPALADTEPGNLNQEVGRWLVELLPSIPERYRAAVELAEVEGLTQVEIAARLGLTHSGAKSRVQRGRDLLRARLLACCRLEFDRRGNVVDYERRENPSACCGEACASTESNQSPTKERLPG